MMKQIHLVKMDDDAFARLWNALPSAEQVAYVMNIPVDTARHRAMQMRRDGVSMKSMRRDELDPVELSNIAVSARKTMEGEAFDVSAREFVILWQLCERVSDMAKITGMSEVSIRTRARDYRNIGVPLKQGLRGKRRANVSPHGMDSTTLGDADNTTTHEDNDNGTNQDAEAGRREVPGTDQADL
jgi:hypothetical protein